MLLALALAGCGGASDESDARGSLARAASARPAAPARDPRFLEACRSLERGDLGAARRLSLALGADVDSELFRARLAADEGDDIGAVRLVERARATHPRDARVFATAAEIHAASARLDSAEAEIRAGLAACGPSPEFARARAVLALARPGGARTALGHLDAAQREDRDLPYCARPRAQAHVLIGSAALAATDLATALAAARAALDLLPEDRDARELEADALASFGDLDAAIERYEGLFAEGAPVSHALTSLLLRGAAKALVDRDRAKAAERYVRARTLGATEDELGFGRTLLADEARACADEGLDLYEAGELAGARAKFEAALRLDPQSIEAENHLAVVLFKQGDHAAAAGRWQRVLELSRARGVALPEPVHLNLARALHQAGRAEGIRAVLEDYLAREPEGAWADATREMLARVAAEEARAGR